MKDKRNIVIIIGIIAFIVILGGISFSYFVYNKNLGDVSVNTGEISINYSDVNGNMSLTGIVPKSDNEGKISTDYIDFTVDGIVDTDKIYYELSIVPDSGNTLDTQYIKVYLTDQEDNVISGVAVYNSLPLNEKETGKRIYRETIDPNQDGTKKTYTKDFRLRVWLDESYSEQTTKTFEFNVNLYAKNVDNDYEIREGSRLIKKAIQAKEAHGGTCSNITWTDPSDEIIYFSGTNDCIDMNYVWYSGKLWRITAIYPDGAMKLITEDMITSITFNATGQVNFYTDSNTTSYMYQWLNEDFYNTLYNANSIIDANKQWNATKPRNTTISTKPSNTNMVTANVGLLNSYEYYNSYRNLGSYSNGYMNLGYFWWLLNPYDNSEVRAVNTIGYAISNSTDIAYAVRPSIYLKSGLDFNGEGTYQSPYRIVGDIEIGVSNSLINTRVSGEYVKLLNGDNNQTFRIIGVEDNKTKIVAMNHADNHAERKFAIGNTNGDGTIYGIGQTATSGEDTWYNYLTETYYSNLEITYGQLFDTGTYYMGQVESNQSYKLGICSTVSGNTITCTKTTQVGTFSIGLPRYGEMFSTVEKGDFLLYADMWLINKRNNFYVWKVIYTGYGSTTSPTSTNEVRPTVHLKSTVVIKSGSGTENDPYVVGLPN